MTPEGEETQRGKVEGDATKGDAAEEESWAAEQTGEVEEKMRGTTEDKLAGRSRVRHSAGRTEAGIPHGRMTHISSPRE